MKQSNKNTTDDCEDSNPVRLHDYVKQKRCPARVTNMQKWWKYSGRASHDKVRGKGVTQ